MRTNNLSYFSEDYMVRSFLEGQWWKNRLGRNFFVVEQLETLGGIPDLVFIRKQHVEILRNFIKKFPSVNLTNGYAKTLATMRGHIPIQIDQICKFSGITSSHLKRVLRDLENLEIIEKTSNDMFQLTSTFEIPEIEIFSLEFKLDDWRRALRQALRYRNFSHYSVVVMPENKKQLLFKNKNVFQHFGIGAFVYFRTTHSIGTIVAPVKRNSISYQAYIDTLGRIKSLKEFGKNPRILDHILEKLKEFLRVNTYESLLSKI